MRWLLGVFCWFGLVPGVVWAELPGLRLQQKTREVSAFLDGVFARELKKYRIPGAIMTIVEGDKVIFAGGFGYANVEQKAPATAQSLFRVGSLSKLTTATVIMQLVEQGKLSLHSDIGPYLKDVTIQKRYPRKITLHQLLTHTSGLDVTDIGDAAKRREDVIPLRRYVAERMTPQVVWPGRYHIYTNHGFALLGYIIEATMGLPFAQAMQRSLFTPLGMTHSSFVQPPPKALREALAVGYVYRKKFQPLPLDFSNVAPADALVTTATDMGRFMLAHLNRGRVGTQQLLKPTTVQQMHTQQFTHYPSLLGYAYGFWEERVTTHAKSPVRYRGLGHTGGQLGFTSKMLLIPRLRLGIFICLNRRVGRMRRSVVQQFLAKFYPPLSPPATAPAKASPKPVVTVDTRRFVGSYRRFGLPLHTLEKISYLIVPHVTVQVRRGPDGSLLLSRYGTLTPQKPLLFKAQKRRSRVAFQQNRDGHITHMFVGDMAYRKLSWLEEPQLHQRVLVFLTLLFLLTWLTWPIERWLRSRKDAPAPKIPGEGGAKLTLLLATGVGLLFLVWLVVELSKAAGSGWDYGLPTSLIVLLNLPYLGMFLTAGMLLWTFLAWQKSFWNLRWRGYYTLVTVGMVVFYGVLGYWNLVGSRF